MITKIDIHKTDKNLKQATIKLLKDSTIPIKSRTLIRDFLEDSIIGLTATNNARVKEIGSRARLKNLYLLKVPARFFKKGFDKIEFEDMKKFIKSLKDNSTKKSNGDYSEKTKSNMKVALITLIRWIHKENPKQFYELCGWIDTRYKKQSPESLEEPEIIKLMDSCEIFKYKVLIGLLFSLGCRIEEFLNIRLKDCRYVEGDIPYYVVTLREEFSKTNGRDIDLIWNDSSELLKQWIELNDKKPEEPLFDLSYDSIRMFLSRLGKRVLNKQVTPHLIRHTSATYDARDMSHSQLCVKYGWSFSSKMPDTYIKRAGVERKMIVEKFKSKKFNDVQEQNKILFERVKKMESQLNEHTQQMLSMRNQSDYNTPQEKELLKNSI